MNDDHQMARVGEAIMEGPAFPDSDRHALRRLLAAQIVGVLNDRQLTMRAAQALTGVTAADFSRIRKDRLGRFTIDRLMTILAGLGQQVEVTVNVRPRPGASAGVN